MTEQAKLAAAADRLAATDWVARHQREPLRPIELQGILYDARRVGAAYLAEHDPAPASAADVTFVQCAKEAAKAQAGPYDTEPSAPADAAKMLHRCSNDKCCYEKLLPPTRPYDCPNCKCWMAPVNDPECGKRHRTTPADAAGLGRLAAIAEAANGTHVDKRRPPLASREWFAFMDTFTPSTVLALIALARRGRDDGGAARELAKLREDRDGWERNAREVAGHCAEYLTKLADMKDECDQLRERPRLLTEAAQSLLAVTYYGNESGYCSICHGNWPDGHKVHCQGARMKRAIESTPDGEPYGQGDAEQDGQAAGDAPRGDVPA